MINRLRAFVVAAAAAFLACASPARAIPLPPDPGEFLIQEVWTGDHTLTGSYIIHNHSSDWFVIDFTVVHNPLLISDADTSVGPTYDAKSWFVSDIDLAGRPAFKFETFSFLTVDMIAPGGHTVPGDFNFGPPPFGTTGDAERNPYQITVVHKDDPNQIPFILEGLTIVPLPGALPLMASMLGGGFLIARWRRRRASAPT